MVPYLAVAGLIIGIALSVFNVYLLWRSNRKDSLAPPKLLLFVPLILNVYSIHQMPMASQTRLIVYLLAITLEVSVDVVWPLVISEWFNGITPLHRASRSGKRALVERLLDNGADINARNVTGWSAIENAAWNGRTDVVDILASRGADLKAWSESVWGNSRFDALGMAASAGKLDVVRLLVEEHSAIDRGSQRGNRALQAAVFRGRREIVKYLLEHGADVRGEDDAGDSVLHTAARRGDITLVNELLARGADVNRKNSVGRTPLKLVIIDSYRKRKTLISLLRERGGHE